MYYSVLDPKSANYKVLDGRDLVINGVLWASENDQVCIVDQVSAKVCDNPGIAMLDDPFRIVDMRDGGRNKPSVSTLFDTQSSVVILGGASSGADHLKRIPKKYQGKVITVNHHHPVGDYRVFADRRTAEWIKGGGERISYWGDLSDYAMDARETGTWFHRNSSFMALWLACCMSEMVVLAGFELVPDATCPTLEYHLALWRSAKKYVPPNRTIVAVEGTPLTSVFGTLRC